MLPYLRSEHADPGRVHSEGHVTRAAIENAREQVADLVGARPREVVFTSSGTEAVNSAVYGAVERARERQGRAHVVTTAVEHSSVVDAVIRWADNVTTIGSDQQGHVDPAAIAEAIRDDTALVSVQTANHEVGTVHDLDPIVETCRDRDTLIHVDACASIGYAPVDFRALDVDLASVTAHKFGGPKGVGALLVRRGLRIPPLLLGGAQERARRGGIENVPGIVGFGAAATEVAGGLDIEAKRLRQLTDRIRAEMVDRVEGVELYGDPDAHLPNLVCLGVGGVEAEPVLLGLDQRGVAVHSGSSCSSETLEPSPVLEAMGVDAEHSLRISLGWSSTDADVDAFLDAAPPVVEGLRSLR